MMPQPKNFQFGEASTVCTSIKCNIPACLLKSGSHCQQEGTTADTTRSTSGGKEQRDRVGSKVMAGGFEESCKTVDEKKWIIRGDVVAKPLLLFPPLRLWHGAAVVHGLGRGTQPDTSLMGAISLLLSGNS